MIRFVYRKLILDQTSVVIICPKITEPSVTAKKFFSNWSQKDDFVVVENDLQQQQQQQEALPVIIETTKIKRYP